MPRASAAVAIALALSLLACRSPPKKPGRDAPLPALDEAALDRSVSPCDDFYQYACGGWIARARIPAERASWSRGFAEVEERNAAQLRRILDAAAAGRSDARDRHGGKLGDFYATCMDEAGIEAGGLAELRAEWARIEAIQDRAGLAAELARMHAVGLAAPFALVPDQDAADATEVILWIYQAGLTLPDREYYLADAGTHPEIRERYAAHLVRMFTLAGLPPEQAAASAAGVRQLEAALAESHLGRAELRDPARTYNRVDREGLARLAPGFPWAAFLAALGHPELEAVSVTTPAFVERAGALFERAPLEAWRSYLRWRLLSRMAEARALPRAMVEEAFAFESASFTGATAQRPRWKHCVDAADEALGFALGEAYVRLHFGPEARERTSAMVREIERAMAASLEAVPWMDPTTRAEARAKLARVVNKVGYPDAWRDYGALKVGRESWFRNVLSAARFEVARELAKVGRPVDRTEWFMSPPTVNAYYSPSLNEMAFPAGILQPPFFNRAAPEPVNYGAIGMVVGHELTHGFDDAGRRFGGDGTLRDWWTPAVARAFEARAECLVEQYSAYETLPGVRLDGRLTLGENIADLGGVKLAYAAMQAARRGRPEAEERLLGFTPEQQFFLGYAQSWCARFRDENARLRAATDPHAPPRFRVNGPLANLPAFGEAFACREGSPMVRPAGSRCEIW